MPEHAGVIKAIDEALDTLPRDVLSHVRGKAEPFPGPGLFRLPDEEWDTKADVEVAKGWLRERFRLVLLAMERDKRAGEVLAQMLPKPWLWRESEVDLSGVSAKERKAYEQECRKYLRDEQKRLEGMRGQFHDSLEKLENEEDTAESAEQTDKQMGYLRACLDCIEHTLKGVQESLRGEVPLVPAASTWAPWYPPAVQAAIDTAGKKDEPAHQEWDRAIWQVPAVWLWVLWQNLPLLARMPSVPGLPDWPGVNDLSEHDRLHFLANTAVYVSRAIICCPGDALGYLKLALEDLRQTIEAGDALAGADDAPPNDDYLPATDVTKVLRWPYKRLTKFLGDHEEIRRYKPRTNRLSVHVADLLRVKSESEKRETKALADLDTTSEELADRFAMLAKERKEKRQAREAAKKQAARGV